MSRYHAAFYHLCISFVVFVFLAYLILFVWYPDFFYTIDGGWEGMRIIIGVDLILGPLLTLIVFKAGKPGLKFDLTAIGILQTICLIAGSYVVYSERPLFFVFYEDHFYSTSADTYSRFNRPIPAPLNHDQQFPAMVIATVPEDPIEEADFRAKLYQSGLPIWANEDGYQPLQNYWDKVLDGSYTRADLEERDEEGKLDAWLATHGGQYEDYAYYPVHSRYTNPFVVIRRADKTFVGIIDIPAPLARRTTKPAE